MYCQEGHGWHERPLPDPQPSKPGPPFPATSPTRCTSVNPPKPCPRGPFPLRSSHPACQPPSPSHAGTSVSVLPWRLTQCLPVSRAMLTVCAPCCTNPPKSCHCWSSCSACSRLSRSGRPSSYTPAAKQAPVPVLSAQMLSPRPAWRREGACVWQGSVNRAVIALQC